MEESGIVRQTEGWMLRLTYLFTPVGNPGPHSYIFIETYTTSLLPAKNANPSIEFLKAWTITQRDPCPTMQVRSPLKSKRNKHDFWSEKQAVRLKQSPHYWQSFVSFIKGAFRAAWERPLVRLCAGKEAHWDVTHAASALEKLFLTNSGWCVMIKGVAQHFGHFLPPCQLRKIKTTVHSVWSMEPEAGSLSVAEKGEANAY